MEERTREELLAQIGELEDTIEVLKKSIIRLNSEVEQLKKTNQALTDRCQKQKHLYERMAELYIDVAYKLKQYEARERVKRLNHDSK